MHVDYIVKWKNKNKECHVELLVLVLVLVVLVLVVSISIIISISISITNLQVQHSCWEPWAHVGTHLWPWLEWMPLRLVQWLDWISWSIICSLLSSFSFLFLFLFSFSSFFYFLFLFFFLFICYLLTALISIYLLFIYELSRIVSYFKYLNSPSRLWLFDIRIRIRTQRQTGNWKRIKPRLAFDLRGVGRGGLDESERHP